MKRPYSPAPILTRDLLTGRFRGGRSYQGWRETGTDDWLLILTLSGQGRFSHPVGTHTTVKAGDVVLVKPGTQHNYGTDVAVGIWEGLWCHFYPRAHWRAWLNWPEDSPGTLRISVRDSRHLERIARRFKEAHQYASSREARSEQFAMNALEEVLLVCASQAPLRSDSRSDPRIDLILEHITGNLGHRITLPQLAAVSGLSVSRVIQLFRRHLGMTPIQYVETQKIARAKQFLVRTTLSVAAVADEVGFDSPFYFTLRFRKATGMPPSQWRSHRAGRS